MDIAIHIGVVLLFSVLSGIFLSGKGSSLIAGYNTASREEKEKYDERALCIFMGKFMAILAVSYLLIAAACIIGNLTMVVISIVIFVIVAFGGAIYANTGSRFLK